VSPKRLRNIHRDRVCFRAAGLRRFHGLLLLLRGCGAPETHASAGEPQFPCPYAALLEWRNRLLLKSPFPAPEGH